MICLSSALFSNYSHPPISLSSFLYHISVLIMIVPTLLLHGASSFHLSLLPRQFMFQSSMFYRCVCLFEVVMGALTSRIER
jgi:hypothetical protein